MDVVLGIVGAVVSITGIVMMGATSRTGLGVGLWLGGIVVLLCGVPFAY
jgi:hypothetical protein